MYAENEKPNAGFYIKQGGPSMARGGGGGPSAVLRMVLGGPSAVLRMVRRDHR